MDLDKVISQLEDLKDNSKDFADKDEPNSVWHDDIVALDIAIDLLKEKKKKEEKRCKSLYSRLRKIIH